MPVIYFYQKLPAKIVRHCVVQAVVALGGCAEGVGRERGAVAERGGAQLKLQNVVHAGMALILVFEHLDLDLKQHMDATPGFGSNRALVKVAPANGPSPRRRRRCGTAASGSVGRGRCVTAAQLQANMITTLVSFRGMCHALGRLSSRNRWCTQSIHSPAEAVTA